jgi:hypothetical protein
MSASTSTPSRRTNSGTKKEEVTRTDLGFDGYTPIAAYLGNEGWAIGLEWRPGSQHSASETEYFYERLFPRKERLVQADQPVLPREDSGFDSGRLLFAQAGERDRLAALGRSFDFLCKWNPRRQDKAAWVAQAEAAGAFEETRPGKRIALLSLEVERAWGRATRRFRLIIQVTERTMIRRASICWSRTSNCRAGGRALMPRRKRSSNGASTTACMSSSTPS